MKERLKRLARCNWRRPCLLLLVVALILPLLVCAYTPAPAPRAYPALLQIAAERPGDLVSVIVRRTADGADSIADIESLVRQQGGTITRDLSIIQAFAADIPAGAIPQIAQTAGVRWISLDAPISQSDTEISTATLQDAYATAIGADGVWRNPNTPQGQGVTVAIVDSGIAFHPDLTGLPTSRLPRVLTNINFSGRHLDGIGLDGYGHGTHVAGIIAGNGLMSLGTRMGVAPKANLVNVRVCDSKGKGKTSDVVAGLQWIYENKGRYNIRVVNLSLNSSVPESYHTSPLDAALEVLWFNGIVVVVSAGNNGSGQDNGILYPPANDPFVITVGATDDRGTADPSDDVLAPFSAYGITMDGHAKPDLVAPGTNIISLLANRFCTVALEHPDHRVASRIMMDRYFRMSGTSMAAAVATGAAALLLQQDPSLTPDQVKYRLMATARPFDTPERAGAGHLDIYAATHSTTKESANTNLEASQLLWSGNDPIAWDGVNWNSVNWNSVNWNSVNWNSVNWNSVNWNSVNWDY